MSRCHTQITLADRRRLHHLVAAKVPLNEMARQLGRHRSTICREIKRNTFRDRELPNYDGYYSTVAHDISRDRRRRLRKLRRHPALRKEIISQLEARWSPEQIAGRLLSDGLSRIRVCKETIYRFIYSKPGPIMDKIIRAFSPLPAFARQSFTFDRGTEFAGFRALEDEFGARSWFCDPSAPWQKGTVENANKRIRRYLPGTTDLAAVSQRDLLALTRHLNDQPRKCLGYMTPAEAFMAHLQDGA